MLKKVLIIVAAFSAGFAVSAQEPVIKKEVREEKGKKVEYMFIDGVKVHETDPEKQPQPPVVEPKPYDAEAARARSVRKFESSRLSRNPANATHGNSVL